MKNGKMKAGRKNQITEFDLNVEFFRPELELESFLNSCKALHSECSFVLGRIKGILQCNIADSNHKILSSYADDFLLEMDILKIACKYMVRDVYYSKEKRETFYDRINNKMKDSEESYGYVIMEYNEVKDLVDRVRYRHSNEIDILCNLHPKSKDYLSKIISIIN